MNSLGAGGAASPKLVNAANALTFCLMVLSCYFSSTLVRYIGIKGALIFGTYVLEMLLQVSPLTILQSWICPLCSRLVHQQQVRN